MQRSRAVSRIRREERWAARTLLSSPPGRYRRSSAFDSTRQSKGSAAGWPVGSMRRAPRWRAASSPSAPVSASRISRNLPRSTRWGSSCSGICERRRWSSKGFPPTSPCASRDCLTSPGEPLVGAGDERRTRFLDRRDALRRGIRRWPRCLRHGRVGRRAELTTSRDGRRDFELDDVVGLFPQGGRFAAK